MEAQGAAIASSSLKHNHNLMGYGGEEHLHGMRGMHMEDKGEGDRIGMGGAFDARERRMLE
ncbi:hypothetical protein HPP92_026937 [Vanilla planifolia]|uniref:Uncharacterized protein n=1 Tax=Vanilla planifolia TaxID=51239 RepID=A0A835U680_VANPL|nr:hypothetical protein HPP92_026937 [Vanilla planifolia]